MPLLSCSEWTPNGYYCVVNSMTKLVKRYLEEKGSTLMEPFLVFIRPKKEFLNHVKTNVFVVPNYYLNLFLDFRVKLI